MGRKKVVIDERQVEELARIGCTDEEMALILKVGRENLVFRCRDVIKRGRAQLKMSLRRAQVKSAIERENVTAQIWLGKNLLGQADQQKLEVSGMTIADMIAAITFDKGSRPASKSEPVEPTPLTADQIAAGNGGKA